MNLDPLGQCLLRRIVEANDDANAIKGLPLEIKSGIAFMDGFARLGIRDELTREFADHLVLMPCEGLDTKEYEAGDWQTRPAAAHKIAIMAIRLSEGAK